MFGLFVVIEAAIRLDICGWHLPCPSFVVGWQSDAVDGRRQAVGLPLADEAGARGHRPWPGAACGMTRPCR